MRARDVASVPLDETVLWHTDEFDTSASHLCQSISAHGYPDLAESVESVCSRPGPLRSCLARSSTHVAAAGETRAAGLARLICWLAAADDHPDVERIISRITPLLRWDAGFAAISVGTESVGERSTVALLNGDPALAGDAVEAIWLAGLLSLVCMTDDHADAVRLLQGAKRGATGPAVGRARVRAKMALRGLEGRMAVVSPGSGQPPGRASRWHNALAMAARCANAGATAPASALVDLLRHLRAGGGWPLPCPANHAFRQRAVRADPTCDGFWSCRLEPQPVATSVGLLSARIIGDPLEVLNLGNAFDTCLRLGGLSEAQLVGWATNTNIRVVGVYTGDGTLVGRRTVGLSLQDAAGLSPYQSYPLGEVAARTATENFLHYLEKATGLLRYDGAAVEDTCVPAYKDYSHQE